MTLHDVGQDVPLYFPFGHEVKSLEIKHVGFNKHTLFETIIGFI